MNEKTNNFNMKNHRRTLGVHLTSTNIFLEYIFPEIKDKIYNYIWVDLYAGKGNLVLPILKYIPSEERINFFQNHIYLFDIQPKMVENCIKNAESFGIPYEIANKNIFQKDNLVSFPKFLKNKELPVYHITNPPYLYLGYIRKHKETEIHLKYFENENEGYQDLYQIAMINDLRNEINNLIYIIPSNFIFGAAVSNKFRLDFLKNYNIQKMYIFETKIFEFTGTNICIGFFKRKKYPQVQTIEFMGTKIKKNDVILKRKYKLNPEFKYRGGAEFDVFVKLYTAENPLKVKYYLLKEEILNNKGEQKIEVIDTSNYVSNNYLRTHFYVNENLQNKVKSNILYVRTVDTGSTDGRAGLYIIKDDFDVDGVYVSKNTYRTSPIHVFLHPQLSNNDLHLLRDYFNFSLEYFREKLDSEFLTTYKYSNAEYTRKYLGLTQVRDLIRTFPVIDMKQEDKKDVRKSIENKDFDKLLNIFGKLSRIKAHKRIDLTKWL